MLLILLAVASFAEEQVYVENEFNFVDGSMDISKGIPENASGRLKRIRLKGVLRVATEPYFAPQEFIDPALSGQEQYVGSDMELAKLVAERMGVKLEIVPMNFTDVLPAVAEGECDLAISGLAFTPTRANQVELSKGYYYSDENTSCRLLIHEADSEKIRSVADLADKKIVAQSGSLQEQMMADNVEAYEEFRRLSTTEDVYRALREGWADAAAVNYENALSYIANNPQCGLMILPDVEFVLEEKFEGDRVAGKKGDFQLMYFVNAVIDEVLESGQYKEWYDQYTEYASRLGL